MNDKNKYARFNPSASGEIGIGVIIAAVAAIIRVRTVT
jgi:hypothetical protein